MARYFLEVSYRGTAYCGFQIQKNGVTIQSKVEDALRVLFRESFSLTGSSRTDAGVHACQNYFHFDTEMEGVDDERRIYNLNSILPADISVIRIFRVPNEAHCRFDAERRVYKYYIYQAKNPFLMDRAYFYPYTVDRNKLKAAAAIIVEYKNFTSFSKRNTQVKNFNCHISTSEWIFQADKMYYHVSANRFLRGMVKALTGTMLRVATGKINLDDFRTIIEARDCTLADFSVASHGLFLDEVVYSKGFAAT